MCFSCGAKDRLTNGPSSAAGEKTYITLEDHVRYGHRKIFSCVAAPSAADCVAVIASSHGIMILSPDDKLRYLDRRDGSSRAIPQKFLNDGSYLSVDYQTNSRDVLFAGTLSTKLKIMDMRQPRSAPWIRRYGRTDYVKSISEHCVLAAGIDQLRPADGDMSVYDIRFLRKNDLAGSNDPLVRFPGYLYHQGDAVDVLMDAGVVAANHEQGMRLYSLRSGRRIPCPVVDEYAPGFPVEGAVWATMPNERNPSLFVAARNGVAKFSFGSNFDDGFGNVPEMITNEPTMNELATNEPTASEPTTSEPTTSEPSSSEPSSSEPGSPRED